MRGAILTLPGFILSITAVKTWKSTGFWDLERDEKMIAFTAEKVLQLPVKARVLPHKSTIRRLTDFSRNYILKSSMRITAIMLMQVRLEANQNRPAARAAERSMQ